MSTAAICFIDSCNRGRMSVAIAAVALIASGEIHMHTEDSPQAISWYLHDENGSTTMIVDWGILVGVQLYQFNVLGEQI